MFGQSLLFVLLAVFQFQATSAFDWAWHTGRATHYGGPGDPWSIHNGYCGYGYLDPNVGKLRRKALSWSKAKPWPSGECTDSPFTLADSVVNT